MGDEKTLTKYRVLAAGTLADGGWAPEFRPVIIDRTGAKPVVRVWEPDDGPVPLADPEPEGDAEPVRLPKVWVEVEADDSRDAKTGAIEAMKSKAPAGAFYLAVPSRSVVVERPKPRTTWSWDS
jgi:hypothetical protein